MTSEIRFILLNAVLACAAVAALLLPEFARGEEYQPQAGEKAPKEEIICEWSKLSSADYAQCQKRKDYYKNLSLREKRQQNAEASKERLVNGVKNAEDRGWRHNAHPGRR